MDSTVSQKSVDFALSEEHRALQERARSFVDEALIPYEQECEFGDGLSEESVARITQAVCDWKFNAVNHSVEDGGQGFDVFEQMILNEQLGRATNALWTIPHQPASALRFSTPTQKEEYLIPTNKMKRRDAYVITEPGAGSDVRSVKTRADRTGSGFKINGEKWFTDGGGADYFLVHAHVDGDPDLPALFFVDKDTPGVSIKKIGNPTYNYVWRRPQFLFEDVEVGEDKLLGEVGEGFGLTKDWFVEGRLAIGGRCVGAATRATDLANDFASDREQFGQPIRDFQAIEFMLADMAVDVLAAKSMLHRVCEEIAYHNSDPKLAHARASAVKLYCSEMANRVCDKALQIFGGRGYQRENPVERLWRDTRADRIWEGTSEIQRQIIGGQIKKRGTAVYTG